jgi:2-deoxy-D-gluconate 3-dehydrogenase
MATKAYSELLDLKGQVALVTGGAMGIGQATAARLAEAGAAVLLSDINLEALQQAQAQFQANGYKVAIHQADARNLDDIPKTIQATIDAFGRIDILVNNAGIFPFTPALQVSEQQWDSVIDLNLKGSFFHSQAAARKMVESGAGGKIVNISSVTAIRPGANMVHYNATKSGLISLTQTLALELGPNQIRVNAVIVGGVNTPGAQQASAGFMATMTPEELAAFFTASMNKIPLRRVGDADDVAKAALFLVSSASDYITGTAVTVDGGSLLAQ